MTVTVETGGTTAVVERAGDPIIIDVVDLKAPVAVVDVAPVGGPQGPQGPPGPPGVVAVAYTDPWPPADPQPDTLYLRLAP